MSTFVAIDFETADFGRDSACAVGLVKVRDGAVVAKSYRLIRPPRRNFHFSYIHGIRWQDVKSKPDFGAVWTKLAPHLDDADYVLAHNASFDRGVLAACCAAHGIRISPTPFVCTVRLARALWDIRPTKLPDVCRYLGIELRRHHDAAMDAMACARIGIAALEDGHGFGHGIIA